jgi:large subunit ribosomal protein L4
VALGPKPRSYRQKTPKKMIQLALCSALSDRAAGERVVVVDEWPWSAPKTADARRALAALALQGKVLVVLDAERHGEAFLSFRNLPDVQLLLDGELNAYDVLCNDWVVFTRSTLPGESVEGPAPARVPEDEAEGEDESQDQAQPDEAEAEGEDNVRDEVPDESQDQDQADESEETPEP